MVQVVLNKKCEHGEADELVECSFVDADKFIKKGIAREPTVGELTRTSDLTVGQIKAKGLKGLPQIRRVQLDKSLPVIVKEPEPVPA